MEKINPLLFFLFLLMLSSCFHKDRYKPKQLAEIVFQEVTSVDGLEAGKRIFDLRCAACHGAKGEGLIGPNHCDDFWIHGGSFEEIAQTIYKGIPEKGMLSWGQLLSKKEISEVASYVYTLRNTKPEGQKAAEGGKTGVEK